MNHGIGEYADDDSETHEMDTSQMDQFLNRVRITKVFAVLDGMPIEIRGKLLEHIKQIVHEYSNREINLTLSSTRYAVESNRLEE